MSSKRQPGSGVRQSGSRRFKQRCAVRMTYTQNKLRGQWAAHGRYISRESAAKADSGGAPGFGPSGAVADLPSRLNAWQQAGDPRLFKLIISPEFGDRLDLESLTRDLLTRMERDLGTKLEWVGTIHRNTEYPHVHVALRAVTDRGEPLRLDRFYVQHGIRETAEDLATARLGYRTELDALEAQRREVHQRRYTSLDRMLNRQNSSQTGGEPSEFFAFDLAKIRRSPEKQNLNARLLCLQIMGLAEPAAGEQWKVREDFERVLRAMQRTADRQRALAAHSSFLSDPRLPSKVTDLKSATNLEGRVLGHTEDEATGRAYMLLEGTDQQVHFIYHTPEIEAAREQRRLRWNSFVRFRRQAANGRAVITIEDLGDCERLLGNKQYLRSTARSLIKKGITPRDNGLGGWLGRYEAALTRTTDEILAERGRTPSKHAERGDGR